MGQIAGIRLAELSDGRGRGVRVADFHTGSGFEFTVHIDRAMDIGAASLNGRSLVWHSATGITHPAYYDPQGAEWLWSFPGGLLCLCGLAAAGAPTADDPWGGHALHGRISNTPAYDVCTGRGWVGDEYELWIEGRAREMAFWGTELELTRRITARAGGNALSVRDRIENLGGEPAPLVLLYHCNFGYPLVDEGSRLIIDSATVTPRDDVAAAGLGRCLELDGPKAGYREQVFFHGVRPDAAGYAQATILNPHIDAGLGLAAYVRYRQAELPYLIEWKQMGAGAYVVGLEPANSMVLGRAREQAAGRLRMLAPGESVELALEFGAIQGPAAQTLAGAAH